LLHPAFRTAISDSQRVDELAPLWGAKAEAIGVECKIGLASRAERVG